MSAPVHEGDREVPCVDCGNPVKFSGWGQVVRAFCDAMLVARKDPPLRDDEVARCRGCYAVYREQVSAGRAADFALASEVFADIVSGRGVPAFRIDALLPTEYGEMIRNAMAIAAERARKPKGRAAAPDTYTGGGFADQ